MTPAERALYNLLSSRAKLASPEMAAAIQAAVRTIAAEFSGAQIIRWTATGEINRILEAVMSEAKLNAAYAPVRDLIRSSVVESARAQSRGLPKPPRELQGKVSFAFDSLSPDVITGIRRLETQVMTTLKDGNREVVRAHIENGLRDGVSPRTTARGIRDVIGLAPNQLRAIENYKAALEGKGNPLDYKLRDRRFDGSITKGNLSAEQIEKQVEAYRRKMIAFNANTNANTAALDAQKLAQRISWQQAIDQGIVNGALLMKTWVTVGDDRVRDEHVAMNGETVQFDQAFSNGEMVPGTSTFNCRCIARYAPARAAA